MDVLIHEEYEKSYACESTESQREVWIAAQMSDEANCAFNESISLRLEGKLDGQILHNAVNDLIQRHDALRSCISRDGRQLRIQSKLPANVERVDLSNKTQPNDMLPDAEARYQHLREQVVSQAFDLSTAPLVRFHSVSFSEAIHVLVITCHHIICDGWSINLLARELGNLYSARLGGAAIGPASSFVDYVKWEGSEDVQRKHRASLKYWSEKLSSTAPYLELPLDKPRPPVKSYRAEHIVHFLGNDLAKRVSELAADRNVSLPAVLIAGFVGFAHRLTGSQAILFGVPFPGQLAKQDLQLVGHCSNVLPMKIDVSAEQTFSQLLTQVELEMGQAYEHQYMTFGTLLKSLDLQRDPSRPALLSTLFDVNTIEDEAWEHEDLNARVSWNPRSFENFDISWKITMSSTGASCECVFNRDLWQRDTIDCRLKELETFLMSGLASPERLLRDLDIIPYSERQLLEKISNGPALRQPARHLSQLLDLQRYAGRTAVSCAGASIDYGELDRRSSRLANHLLDMGVQRSDLLGVFVERSVDMLVSLLATWKAGAAYVALDPEYPAERLLYMAETASLKALITKSGLDAALSDYSCPRVYLDKDAQRISRQSEQGPGIEAGPEDTAYVIFTSGSTGQPKGVQITHGGVINFLVSMAQRPGLAANDRLLAVTTLSFDIAVLELCLPLLVGARVVIAEREEALDGCQLLTLIDNHKINVMQATPTTWRWMLAAGWQGQQDFKALCGGEAFPPDLARQLTECLGEVWNMYGPTETTVWSTCYRLQGDDDLSGGPIPIGPPIANTQCYVLDENRELLPAGVPGELYIGGAGVANGYLRQPQRTAERFVENPLGEGKLYRTGDQARWRLDGLLECLGRLDSQIKLRGFRVELGEIEASLSKHPEVIECAASVVSYSESDQRLVAYARTDQGSRMNSTEMRRYLRGFLPDYMVPQLFVEVDALPLTPNGKIDRKSLPNPVQVATTKSVVRPRTHIEKDLVDLWSELLQKKQESVNELFFDVGGHSLLAMDMTARIDKRFGVRIHLLDILVNTIEQIAAIIESSKRDDSISAEDGVGASDEAHAATEDYTVMAARSKPGLIGRLFGR